MMEADEAGYIKLAYNTKFPCALGHEFSAQVVDIGKDVTKVEVGDMVSIEEVNWCGKCLACCEGHLNQCQDVTDIGFTKNGAFAEYVVADEKYVWKLNDVMEAYQDEDKVYELGALVEPTGVAYEGLFSRGGGIRPGGHVAVFGSGPIGLAAIALAKTSGAAKIINFELSDIRRKLAKDIGADYVYNPLDLEKDKVTEAQVIMEITKGVGAHMLVEATGDSRAVMPQLENALEHGAKAIILGITPGAAPVDLVKYQLRGARIQGALGHCGGDFPRVISLMASKRIDMTKAITSRFPLGQALEAIEQTAKVVDGKVLVKPEL
jgi:threonine dehydrogenase-like Zn-dependent dehydrogenase